MNPFQISCPHCHQSVDVESALADQLESSLKKEYNQRLENERRKMDDIRTLLEKEKEAFEEKKRNENQLFQERFQKALSESEKRIALEQRKKIQEEETERLKALQDELNQKSEQIKELHKTRAEIEKLRREKEELRDLTLLEAEKKTNELIHQERERIRKTEEERNELRIRDLQKKLDDQMKLTEEMNRKLEQGSMQLQGEVQELAIESWLREQFPLDNIDEIKKGARGADCLQIVNTRQHQQCGTIYYESKRTKDFQPGWIEKFKQDIREKGADIGVLVTDAMPADMQRLGLRDGIWICNFEEFKGLCSVLRESIVQLHNAVSAQENKGDKMHLLYDFLTGNQFRMQVESIVEGFSQMKSALDSEKRSMQRIWKEREKQIEKVITNTIDMYGSIRGIAGNAIQVVKALELPDATSEIDQDEE